jgi:hypothetical protein
MVSLHVTTVASKSDTDTFTRTPVKNLIDSHLPTHVFLPIITRDTPNIIPKPDPAGILHIASEWGLGNRAESMIMVSIAAYSFDFIICGQRY